jgi:hypothetical protein
MDSIALEPAAGANLTVWQQAIAFSEALLLAVWLGSMIFFSFAVAPSAFAVLPGQRELAGRIVTSTIGKVEMLGLIIGPLLLIIQVVTRRVRRSSRRSETARFILISVMILAAALSKFWVGARLVALRVSMGVIDNVPASDPQRVEFNHLHQYSVALMGAAMIAGIVVLFLTVRSWLKR